MYALFFVPVIDVIRRHDVHRTAQCVAAARRVQFPFAEVLFDPLCLPADPCAGCTGVHQTCIERQCRW
jgi:hypothetical protein